MLVPNVNWHGEFANYWFRVLHLVQVLVWVTLDHALLLLLEMAFLLVWIECVRSRDAKLLEVRSCLSKTLRSMGILDPQSKHCSVRFFRMEYAFNLALEFKEIVLAQIDFP